MTTSYSRKHYSLTKVPLNRGGYDSSGQYYGTGLPLYRAVDLVSDRVHEFRCRTRTAAIAEMLRKFPPPQPRPRSSAAANSTRALAAVLRRFHYAQVGSKTMARAGITPEQLAANLEKYPPSSLYSYSLRYQLKRQFRGR